MAYDSAMDIMKHKIAVYGKLMDVIVELGERARLHDNSKLVSPEKEMYDEYVPLLRETAFGSEERFQVKARMGKGLLYHYEGNRHHPEHFDNGINDMTLIDVVEMLADWAAAVTRQDDDLMECLYSNAQLFGISGQLVQILENTARELGWS